MREEIAAAVITLLNAGANPAAIQAAIKDIEGVEFIACPDKERLVN